jgi:hypothetical protein
MKTKVHLMTVLLIDHDDLGAEGTEQVLEDARYPNDCLYPTVLNTQTQEVDWDDDHPLNSTQHVAQAVADLFPSVTHAAIAEAEERGRREGSRSDCLDAIHAEGWMRLAVERERDAANDALGLAYQRALQAAAAVVESSLGFKSDITDDILALTPDDIDRLAAEVTP